MNVASLLVLTTLAASSGLYAQTTPSTPPSSGTVHYHHVTPGGKPRTAAALPATPALPPGVPPAPGQLQTAFSLRYIDSKVGDGAVVQPGQYLTVQYTGWLASDGTKFDSSYDAKAPFTFPQGMRRVIAGWDQGFEGMRVGGKRRLFIPYQLAYGDVGHPPVIPPKSDLIFDLELVGASATPAPEPAPQ